MSPKSSLQGDLIDRIIDHPDLIGRQVGFNDLTPLHGEWIREMVAGEGDYTLQAHRGSYKSSCLAIAISLLLVLQPTRNIIFLRKTDSDVAEMMIMVSKILQSRVMDDIAREIYDRGFQIIGESAKHLSTDLWTSPMGAPQLQGLGIGSSITGKHSWYVITDDICNKDDRESRAERERTKRQYDELQNMMLNSEDTNSSTIQSTIQESSVSFEDNTVPTMAPPTDPYAEARAQMSEGGRFTTPTDVTVSEDGSTEYIIPVEREDRALPLMRQLLSELSPAAREGLTGEMEQMKGGSSFLSTVVTTAISALTEAIPSSNTVRNVSAPVNINVTATGGYATDIGRTIYNTAERYLLRTLEA